MTTSAVVETVYIWKGNTGKISFNEYNSHCYVDMVNDMTKLNNGVFSATIKLDLGNICDYVSIENNGYADSSTSENNKVYRR